LIATFREEDAAAGRPVSGAVRLRQLVSEASGGQAKSKAAPTAAGSVKKSESEPLGKVTPGMLVATGVAPQPL
jgi:hypothetical protein